MAQVEMFAAKANSPVTELTAAITDVATTVSVLDASKLPDAPNIATIGVDETAETIKYTGKSGNTLTGVTRGFSGTAAKAWAIGVGVARYFTAYDADALRQNVADTASKLEVAGVANAQTPLFIPTYDGSNQSTHPKVLKLDTAFGGWKWWLSYTPYPAGDDDYENPSVAYSSDGVTWYAINGNPIDQPTAGEIAIGGFMSDGHIFIKNGVMELWYRYATNSNDVKIFRKTSTNGTVWTERELMIDCALTGERVVAPALIYENNLYKMWYINQDRFIMYDESVDGFTWNKKRKLNVPNVIDGYTAWHLDITKTDLGYEFVCNYTKGSSGDLYYWNSVDNISFTVPEKILSPSTDTLAWDNGMIYRSSLIKEGGLYKVYYSAVGRNGRWFIGLTSGSDIKNLKGTSNIQYLGMTTDLYLQNGLVLPEIKALSIGSARFRRNKIELKSGSSGATIEISNADEISFRNNAGSDYGDVKVKKIGASGDITTPTNVDCRKLVTDFIQMDLATVGLASSAGIIQYDNTSKILSFHDGNSLYHLNSYVRNVPVSPSSVGIRGTWTSDASYLYVCHNTNQWIRVAKDSTW
ncbi:hypothetical protein [Paenibacillus sp. B-A-8]|uniref:hypothetical protein n=1 Tax=Paenibacillus sp. B-A-8 TaxID=3400419 RepID=UPI003B0199C4